MPVKSIVTIDVDDSSFKKFYELFEKYSAEVDKQPEAWKALGEAMGESTQGLAGGAVTAKESLALAATQAAVIAEALQGAVKAQHALGDATKRSEGVMSKLHASAKGVGSAISTIGGWIVRIAAFGGLGGLLSGLGIGELAGAAFSRSRTAGRLGMSTGALASFEVNAQRFLGTNALQNAAASQNDITKMPLLAALGIQYAAAQKMSPADLAFEELRRARAAFLQNPAFAQQMPAVQAYEKLSGEDIGTIRQVAQPGGLAALNAAQRNYHRDISALDIPSGVQEKWNSLKITLDRAGMTIETVFIDKLSSLAPPIEQLATDFTRAISAFAGSGNAKFAIDELSKGMTWLGTYLGSAKFQTDVKNFEYEIGWIADKLKWMLPKPASAADEKLFGHLRTKNTAEWNAVGGGVRGAWNWAGDKLKAPQRTAWGLSLLNKLHAPYTAANIAFLNRWQGQENTNAAYNPLATTQPAKGAGAFNSVGVRNYLTPQQGYDATIKTLKNGYYPDIVKGLMAGNPWRDKRVSSQLNTWGTGSGWYDAESKHWYKGKTDIAKAIFNSVIRTVDDDVKKYGKNWASHLPKDAAAFVAGAHLSAREKHSTDVSAINKTLRTVLTRRVPKPAHVSITNQTSARVAVSINAVAVS